MEKGKTGNVAMPNNFDYQSDELFKNTIKTILKTSKAKCYDKLNKKVYFAGPWFDERANMLYDASKKILDTVGKNLDVFYPREKKNKTPKDAFINNVENIKNADMVVALVSRKDVGTAWEIGMAYSMGKPIYLLGYDNTTFLSHTNVMLAFTGKCITLDKFAKFLSIGLQDDEFVNISNKWDGIE